MCAYWHKKELDKLRVPYAAAKTKPRKQREKETKEGATADCSCDQQLPDPHVKR
jgi:hypothetical protein